MVSNPNSPHKRADGGSTTDDNSKRKFTVRFEDGTEKHQFQTSDPYFAALKAARKLVVPDGFTDPETAEEQNSVRLYLREIGTRTLYVYDVWTWERNYGCPECESRRVYTRKSKTPTYRCGSCGAEFDEPIDATDLNSESDLPEYLGDDGLTEAEADSRGRSKVPDDEIRL